jgi:hypothetical protein
VSPTHQAEPAEAQPATLAPPSTDAANRFVVPAGTKIPLALKQGITTKNARIGDPVYAQTVFPIVQNDTIVIPSGTFVQGVVRALVRPGRVKGRAQLQMSFNSMIFPNGYTIMLPGAVDSMPGSQNTDVKGTEGTIQQGGSKAKDAQTIAATSWDRRHRGRRQGCRRWRSSGGRGWFGDGAAHARSRYSARSGCVGGDDPGTQHCSGPRETQ